MIAFVFVLGIHRVMRVNYQIVMNKENDFNFNVDMNVSLEKIRENEFAG